MRKKDLTEIARIIKQIVSIEDVLKYHNIDIKNKRIKCLLHDSSGYNMSYARKNSLYCPSGCGILNVIDLYMHLHNCDFITALQALDSIFNLNLFDIPNEQIAKQAEQYRLQQIKLKQEEERQHYNYLRCCDCLSYVKACCNSMEFTDQWDKLTNVGCFLEETMIKKENYKYARDINTFLKTLIS